MRVKIVEVLEMTNWTKESTIQVILSIFQISVRTRPRARFVRAQHVRSIEMSILLHFRDPDTFLNKLQQFST